MSKPVMTPFLAAYIRCALWGSTDRSGNPIDDNYDESDIHSVTLSAMARDCREFQRDYAELLAKAGDDEQNGHDFWLTRNRHGAGFWDRGYGEVGDKLTEAAHAYGSVDLEIWRGRVYQIGAQREARKAA